MNEDDVIVHDNDDSGCDSCGTCRYHAGCADTDNPIVKARGDCPRCGACGDCLRECARMRQEPLVTVEEAPEGDPGMARVLAWFRNGGC